MKFIQYSICLFLLLFGAVSLFMTTSIIFDWFGIRELEGNYVPFIVYANLICGFLYLLTSYLLFKNKKSASYLLLFASILLILSFISLGIYINNGGIYEEKTVKAMTFRSSITLILTFVSYKLTAKRK
ncbi:MAG: hypothetical protein RBT46_08590 [Weeksellaceae bacterium]|nr:hypothetical protein [Weeksellaceae bacterium]